jgi:HAD superfamily hydrolase (TIGR01490 family)
MAWFVRGYSLEAADQVWDFSVNYLDRFWRTDTIGILNEHKENGDLVMLVSSGPEPLLQKTAQKLGVDHFVGTKFEIKDGHFTGRSLKPTCIEEFKASMARDYLARNGFQVDYGGSYSYADSIADLQMLKMAGNPTVVYADEPLVEIANQNGWKIYPPPESF